MLCDGQSLVAQVIGAPLAAGLLYMDGLGGLRGWQWLFIIEGLVTSIYGILLKVSRLPVVPCSRQCPFLAVCSPSSFQLVLVLWHRAIHTILGSLVARAHV